MVNPVANDFDFSISASDFQDRYLTPFWQRRMVEVSVLCRVVELECPRLASDCGLNAAYRQLQSAAARAERVRVARSSCFGSMSRGISCCATFINHCRLAMS